ncbi:hypothetical protein CDD81_4750 [Ophiocordyceps australis]|uniref:Integral membrane protein n=1 Tax=Ophiocordyceps australis TaxID=1399860 RepID=A0A2C5Y975_9HYPO|nr:hypothetical protein CDD81_4750 [Ophiocordyceps australis]
MAVPVRCGQDTRQEDAPTPATVSSSWLAPSAEAAPSKTRLVRSATGVFSLAPGSRLENNLSWVVGCLELANAGDFAANVWNEVPVPVYAVVLMGLGGTLAAVLSVFALRDARRAWHNVCFVRLQRRRLRQAGQRAPQHHDALSLAVLLAVTFRELWSEVINRWAMDLLMGFGAVLISAGTYMAIAGANRSVWEASNILSGYLGNTPIALFGLVNSSWAGYMWLKAHGHRLAVSRLPLLRDSPAAALVRQRVRHVQIFCIVNGSATLLGGAASMLTASYWWAYVILIPVIVSSLFCNLWWRRRLGYTRAQPRLDDSPLELADLASRLEFAAMAEHVMRSNSHASNLDVLVGSPSASLPLSRVLHILAQHALLDTLILDLVSSSPEAADHLTRLSASTPANGSDAVEYQIGEGHLAALPESMHAQIISLANACVGRAGARHFGNRKRWLAELLGTYCSQARKMGLDAADSSQKPVPV